MRSRPFDLWGKRRKPPAKQCRPKQRPPKQRPRLRRSPSPRQRFQRWCHPPLRQRLQHLSRRNRRSRTAGWPATQLLMPGSSFPSTRRAQTEAVPLGRNLILSGAVDVAEGYTNNAQGSSSGGKPDSFTRGQLDLGLHYQSLRLKVDAHSSTSAYYYNHFHDANQLNEHLNLTSNAELVRDHLFLNLNAFATPVALTPAGAFTAAQGLAPIPAGTSSQTYGYTAAPVFKMRFYDFAKSESSINESQLFVKNSSAPVDPNPRLPASRRWAIQPLSVQRRDYERSLFWAAQMGFGRLLCKDGSDN